MPTKYELRRQGNISSSLELPPLPNLEEQEEQEEQEEKYFAPIKDTPFNRKRYGYSSLGSTPTKPVERDEDRSAFWDTVPEIYKQAYNNSLGGIMREMMTGQKYYNLSNEPKGMVHDIAAGFLSFFASKEDLALFATTAGVGSLASKAAIKGIAGKTVATGALRKQRAAAMLSKRGGLSTKAAKSVIDDVVEVGGQQAFILGAHDGFYEAVRDARDEILASDVDLPKYENMNYGQALGAVMKSADPKDFFRGGALGLAGGVGRMSKLISPIGKGSMTAAFVGEGVTFGALSPIAYEGRLPGWQDLVVAGGLTGALTLPLHMRTYAKKLKRQGFGDELSKKETEALARKAAIEDIVVRDKSQLYERPEGQAPFVRVQDLPDKRKKNPNLQFKMGRGTFQTTNIYGKPVKKVSKTITGETIVPEGTQIKGNIIETIEYGKLQELPFLKARIVNGSFKQSGKKGKGFEMQIDVDGKGRFELDAFNTDLFFEFHTADVELLRKFELNINNIQGKRRAIGKLHDHELRKARRDALGSKEGLLPEDWNNSLVDTINQNTLKGGEHGFFRWAQAIENGQTIRIKNMSHGEKVILTRNLRNQKIIRDFVENNAPLYDGNYQYLTYGKNTGLFSNILGPLLPFYKHLDDPAARKTVRLINNVTQATHQKTGERMMVINEIVNVDESKWWVKYLSGEGEVSAWRDFNEAQEVGGLKLWLRAMDERIAISSGQEAKRLKLRKNLLIDTNTFTTDSRYKIKLGLVPDEGFVQPSIWEDAISANLKLARKVDGYLPRMFRKDVLDIMFNVMDDMEAKVIKITELPGFNLDGNYSSEVLAKLNSELEAKVRLFTASKKPGAIEFKKVWDTLKAGIASAGEPSTFDVFRVLNHGMYTHSLRAFSPLEKGRKLGAFDFTNVDVAKMMPSELMEKNFTKLLVEYTGGATKRIELSKAFTPTGAYFEQLISKIDPNAQMVGFKLPKLLGGQDIPLTVQTQSEAVRMIKESFTGEVNFNKATNFSQSFQTIANLEMMGKISLGQAVIPNLTQTFISTIPQAGFGTTLRGLYRLATDSKLRERVKKSGATILTAFDELMVQEKALQIGAEKITRTEAPTKEFIRNLLSKDNPTGYVDGITWLTRKTAIPFSKVNQWNQMIAAASAEGLVLKLGKAIKGKDFLSTLSPSLRKKWARNKLGRMGLREKDVLKNLDALEAGRFTTKEQQAFRTKLLQSMQRFSMESQLQRDFLLDPFLFNDPMLKPLLLFKRFGYRQAAYMKNTLEREFLDGNVMPIINLGLGGLAGGSFVMWAKEKLNQILTGEEQFYGRESRIKLLKKDKSFDDYFNALASVGSFGVMSDIMTDEDPGSAISFFLKPVVIDDFQRVIRSYETFAKSMETHYPEQWDVPFRKASVVLAPIAGGNISRLTKRALETEGMKKDRIRNTKGKTVQSIRDMIEEGNNKQAVELYVDFNKTYGSIYPSLRIQASDISWKSIRTRWERRVKQQREEKQYIP